MRSPCGSYDNPSCHFRGPGLLSAIVAFVSTLAALALVSQPAMASESFQFKEAARELGVDFRHETGVGGKLFMPEIFGSGVALFDLEGDGDLDLLALDGGIHGQTTTAAQAEHSSPVGKAARVGSHRLWRQGVDGKFTEVANSGLEGGGYGMGVAVGDVDGDGHDDLFISSFAVAGAGGEIAGDSLFRNRGDGTFEDITAAAGLSSAPGDWGTSALFFDVDDDGDLDLFAVRYLRYEPPLVCSDQAGRTDYCGPGAFAPSLDRLWRNDGSGRFEDITENAGLTLPGKGLGAVAADFDGNGLRDLYVANDGEPNRLWLQGPKGQFVDRALANGAAVDALGRPEAGMGIGLGDVDNDGLVDLFLSHLRTETNTLYTADAELGFLDATLPSGLGGPSLPYTGFGTFFADFDRDGDLDLVVANGAVTRNLRPEHEAENAFGRDYGQKNLAFENVGGRFRVLQAGDFTGAPTVGRALARGDLDDDGDLDIVESSSGGRLRIYLNEADIAGSRSKKGWAMVQLHGNRADRGTVTVSTSTVSTSTVLMNTEQTRVLSRGQSYLTSHDPRAFFGLGDAERIDHLEIDTGKTLLRFGDLPVNRRFLILEEAP